MSLELNALGVAYGGRRVLHGVTGEMARPGELVALLGANGAGKSSLLRSIAGLCPMEGQARLDGDDLARLRPAQRLQRVAYMPQSLPQASALTVYEALLGTLRVACAHWGAAQTRARIAWVLEVLELEPLALRPLATLSGGQRQMAALAQLLARNARLLLLDEPTSALDLRWQMRLLQTLRDHVRLQRTPCMLALHDLNLAARWCDRVVLMAGGCVLAHGTPREVLTSALLERAYGVQARVECCSQGAPVVLVDAVPRGVALEGCAC